MCVFVCVHKFKTHLHNYRGKWLFSTQWYFILFLEKWLNWFTCSPSKNGSPGCSTAFPVFPVFPVWGFDQIIIVQCLPIYSFTYLVLRIEVRTWYMLGECSITELYPQLSSFLSFSQLSSLPVSFLFSLCFSLSPFLPFIPSLLPFLPLFFLSSLPLACPDSY